MAQEPTPSGRHGLRRTLVLALASLAGGTVAALAALALGSGTAGALAAGLGTSSALAGALALRLVREPERAASEPPAQRPPLRSALDFAPVGVVVVDAEAPDLPIVDVNEGFVRLTGFPREEILGRNCRFLNRDDRDQPELDAVREALRRREPVDVVLRNRRKDGTPFWNHLTIAPAPDADGKVRRLVGVQIDATARTQRETERDATLERITAARLDAEAANRLRDRLLSFASHELRSPLNAMRAWLSVLASSPSARTRGRAIEVLERNLALQSRLVEDLLDAARFASGKLSLERRRCDLAAIVRAVFEGEQPVAAERGIELKLDAPRSVPIDGDAERLLQAVGNLVGNAIKFTDEGGRIELELAVGDGTAAVSVRDSGRGISPEALPHVFDLYHQEGDAPASGEGGLGLGLAIVSMIVAQHGGAVSAHSDGLGKGARFELRLPVASGAHPTREEEPEPSPDILNGVRILIVDANRFAAEALAVTLEEANANVEWASDVAAAEANADAALPDVLVSALDEASATTLLKSLRARNPSLRTLTFVEPRSGDLRSRLRRAGFEVAVRVSMPPSEVRGRIIRLLGRQPSILLVDDDRDSADSLALLLGRRGFDVTVAYGFDEALARAEPMRLGLVVTDIAFDDGDGIELARRLRLLGARRVVAVSGRAEDEADPASEHFDGYVRKPVDLDQLLACLAGD